MPKVAIICDNCGNIKDRYTWRINPGQKHFFCDRPCRNEYTRSNRKSEYDSYRDDSTHSMYDVVDSVKNVLPVCKNMTEYKEFCKRATARILSNERNPY